MEAAWTSETLVLYHTALHCVRTQKTATSNITTGKASKSLTWAFTSSSATRTKSNYPFVFMHWAVR